MTKQEIIYKAFYQLPDLDESYIEVLEDMHSAIIDKACEWLKSYRQETPDGLGYIAGIVNDKTIEEFRKAMEE